MVFFGLETSQQAVAICFDWEGSATFERINSFLKGVIIGMNPVLSEGRALILISTGDIGRIFGRHAREELLFKEPIDWFAISKFRLLFQILIVDDIMPIIRFSA